MTIEREAAQTRAGKKIKKIPHRVVPGRGQAAVPHEIRNKVDNNLKLFL